MRPMPCDHLGGPELIEMTENHLRQQNVPLSHWSGLRFRWAENLSGSMWASVIIEIERRGDQWIVCRLDRNRDSLPASETGFRRVG